MKGLLGYKRVKSKAILLFAMLLAVGMSQAQPGPRADQQQAASPVRWSPIVESSSVDTDEVFPAEMLALAMRHVQKVRPTYLGDPNSVLGVKVVTATPNAHIRVLVKADRLVAESSFETSIPEANREYEIWPSLRFDSHTLTRIQESFPTTAVFTVFVNGVSVGEQTKTIRVRSVNDVPLFRKTRDGRVEDLSPLFAAFVDENHPWIDGVLSEALKYQAIREFTGYQSPPREVLHQVFAIWNVLQRRQVRYSSITRPSGESETIRSQHVRFLDETIRASQANCVDGTVLFASIIYKLGMCPVLVIIPGHMFLGFHVDSQSCGQGRNLVFLETTLIGDPGLNRLERGWRFQNPDMSYKSSESYRQFMRAVEEGNRKFQSIVSSVNNHQAGYHVVEIIQARRVGIAAIPHF
jgi:hypothetical protein